MAKLVVTTHFRRQIATGKHFCERKYMNTTFTDVLFAGHTCNSKLFELLHQKISKKSRRWRGKILTFQSDTITTYDLITKAVTNIVQVEAPILVRQLQNGNILVNDTTTFTEYTLDGTIVCKYLGNDHPSFVALQLQNGNLALGYDYNILLYDTITHKHIATHENSKRISGILLLSDNRVLVVQRHGAILYDPDFTKGVYVAFERELGYDALVCECTNGIFCAYTFMYSVDTADKSLVYINYNTGKFIYGVACRNRITDLHSIGKGEKIAIFETDATKICDSNPMSPKSYPKSILKMREASRKIYGAFVVTEPQPGLIAYRVKQGIVVRNIENSKVVESYEISDEAVVVRAFIYE